jgi:hypothetical protein
MADNNGFSPWTNMNQAPSAPEPSTTGTKRDYGNMLNEKIKPMKQFKPHKMGTHWELPKKMKLNF